MHQSKKKKKKEMEYSEALDKAVKKYYHYAIKYHSARSPSVKKLLWEKMDKYERLVFQLFREEYMRV